MYLTAILHTCYANLNREHLAILFTKQHIHLSHRNNQFIHLLLEPFNARIYLIVTVIRNTSHIMQIIPKGIGIITL